MTAAELIKQREGFSLTAYQDDTGRWTIGWGCTGPDIKEGTVWTLEQAEADLAKRISHTQAFIQTAVSKRLSPNQLTALTSFVFNEGAGAFYGSTLRKLLNAGNFPAAADEFLKWDKEHVGGKVVTSQGLLNRRVVEQGVFLG